MEIIGAIKGIIDKATKPPVTVGGENLVGMTQGALKERVFQRLVSDPLQWNGAHAMRLKQHESKWKKFQRGKQGMIDFLQGAEQFSKEVGHKK